MSSNYREFIQTTLQRAGINQEYRESFTDTTAMTFFEKVVTHPTHDPKENYQELEFIGDGIIKAILSQYIPRRFVQLTTPDTTIGGALSKTRRLLEQRQTLSQFGLKLGFWPFVKADTETLTTLRKQTLEDVFEAFVGAITELVDSRLKPGLGYYIAYKFVKDNLDELPIQLSEQELDDPITRLNELYRASKLKYDNPPLKWGTVTFLTKVINVKKVTAVPTVKAPIGTLIFIDSLKHVHIATETGWAPITKAPLIDFKYDEYGSEETHQQLWYAGVYGFPSAIGKEFIEEDRQKLKQIIGQGIHFKLINAKKMASTQALTFLQTKGLFKERSSGDGEEEGEGTTISIEKSFDPEKYKIFISNLLKLIGINIKFTALFTDNQHMKIWQYIINHNDDGIQAKGYDLAKFIGDGIIKGILNQYLARKFKFDTVTTKQTGEGPLSKARRYLEQKKIFSVVGEKLGFSEYISSKDPKILHDVFSAFIGTLVDFIDRYVKNGLGYYFAYKFITQKLDELNLKIEEEELDDPITKLNEFYKKPELGWGDVLYRTTKLFVPSVMELPREITPEGTVIVLPDETIHISQSHGKWLKSDQLPYTMPILPTIFEADKRQIWFIQVYGYITLQKFRPNVRIMRITPQNKDDILRDPGKYRIDLIGHGFHANAKEAKKIAAQNAIQTLKKNGYNL